jgi:hypothetical protein
MWHADIRGRRFGGWSSDFLRLALPCASMGCVELPSWDDAREAFRGRRSSGAELACAFVVHHVWMASGSRWLQGERRPWLVCRSAAASARIVARYRLSRVPEAAHRALVGWANGERAGMLRFDVPHPLELLALQAQGGRCVSLLLESPVPQLSVATARPASARSYGLRPRYVSADPALEFVLHDLCHLEKFAQPSEHAAQVGFFALVYRATQDPQWGAFCALFDETWERDFEHVVADMNGSAIFLFAALKMKLKMAVRRRVVREGGPEEALAYRAHEEDLFDLLSLRDRSTRAAARAVTTKRDARQAAEELFRYFEGAGGAECKSSDQETGPCEKLAARRWSTTSQASMK